MKKLILGIGMLAALTVFSADTDLTQQKNWTLANIAKGAEAKFTKKKDGSLLLTTDSPYCYLTHKFKFRKGKILRLEGKIESGDTYCIKFYFIDEKGKLINEDRFHVVPDTGSELTAAASENDKILKVKDASKWNKGRSIAVGKGIELPNQHLYPAVKRINAINPKNGYWEVVLKQPWGKNCPAGTPVRQMVYSDGRLVTNQYRLPVKPVNLSCTLQDEFTTKDENYKWRQGAVSISMQVIMGGKSKKKQIRFTDLKIRELESW